MSVNASDILRQILADVDEVRARIAKEDSPAEARRGAYGGVAALLGLRSRGMRALVLEYLETMARKGLSR